MRQKENAEKRARGVLIFIIVVVSLSAGAEAPGVREHRVSAWSAAMHAPLPFPGLPPLPVFENQTIRMIVRPTIGGEGIRIRFPNAFGALALKIGAAHITMAAQDSKTVRESDHALTFGGASSITIPPGAPALSDAVDLYVSQSSEIALSLFLPNRTPSSTVHFRGQHKSYISETGDFTGKAEMPTATANASWYWLADVEVTASDQAGAIVTSGDSIADGVGANQGDHTDWPDLLTTRLPGENGAPPLAVVNEGIGGNRILRDGPASARLHALIATSRHSRELSA